MAIHLRIPEGSYRQRNETLFHHVTMKEEGNYVQIYQQDQRHETEPP